MESHYKGLGAAGAGISKSGSLTHSFAGEPDGVPDWPNGVPLGAGYVVPRTGGHGVERV